MSDLLVSVVIIGRNEGERLVRCLESVEAMEFAPNAFEIIYVDSGSSDGSLERAGEMGAKAVPVPPGPTTAARGRNTGIKNASAPYILFLDGDTILDPQFVGKAFKHLETNPKVAGVCGDRIEISPEASIYNRIQDMEWNGPYGYVGYFGGDALVRKSVLDEVGAYNQDLLAGEEPELCHRIRKAGYLVEHLDLPMTQHDMDMHQFSSYWRRNYRTGYAYAEVSEMTDGETWGSECKRNRLQASIYMFGPILLLGFLEVWALPLILFGGLLLWARTVKRNSWRPNSAGTKMLYAFHAHFCQIPIFWGQMKYLRNRRRNVTGKIIEYK